MIMTLESGWDTSVKILSISQTVIASGKLMPLARQAKAWVPYTAVNSQNSPRQ